MLLLLTPSDSYSPPYPPVALHDGLEQLLAGSTHPGAGILMGWPIWTWVRR